MKKRMIFVLFALVFLLCSCEMPISMAELLEYQNNDFSCDAILDGKTKTELHIKSNGGKIIISIADTEYMNNVSFVFSADNAEIICDEIKIPMENTDLQRLFTVYKMMTLDHTEIWHITREKNGGIEVYKCICDGYTAYIDAKTHLPLRFEHGEEALDIIRMDF